MYQKLLGYQEFPRGVPKTSWTDPAFLSGVFLFWVLLLILWPGIFSSWNKPLLIIEALREELYWCLYNSSLLGVRSGHPENPSKQGWIYRWA